MSFVSQIIGSMHISLPMHSIWKGKDTKSSYDVNASYNQPIFIHKNRYDNIFGLRNSEEIDFYCVVVIGQGITAWTAKLSSEKYQIGKMS